MGRVKDYRDGLKDWLDKPARTSFVLDGSCQTCANLAEGEMCPPHDASPRCESGKRNHCSCDTCF